MTKTKRKLRSADRFHAVAKVFGLEERSSVRLLLWQDEEASLVVIGKESREWMVTSDRLAAQGGIEKGAGANTLWCLLSRLEYPLARPEGRVTREVARQRGEAITIRNMVDRAERSNSRTLDHYSMVLAHELADQLIDAILATEGRG